MRAPEIPKVESFNSKYSDKYLSKTPGFNANKEKVSFWDNRGFEQPKDLIYH